MNNLNENELKLLNSLENPDEPKPKKYQFDIEYQQDILGMLIMDRLFLIQGLQLIKPQYFIEKVHENICQVVFDYFNEYKELPSKKSIQEEIRKKFPSDNKKVNFHIAELETICRSFISGLISRDSCLDLITEFAKDQSIRLAISKSLDILEKNAKDRFVKIENIMKDALLVDRNFDVGLDYFQTLEERYERMQQQTLGKEVFITGFPSIENGLSANGLCRGEISAFVGLSGAGKSLLLTKVAVRNLVRGKKILYVSLEMDQDKTAKRFDSQISRTNIKELLEKKDQVIISLKNKIAEDLDKRRLIIKQFPAGTLDVAMLRAYLSQMSLNGFNPDMICLDYVGEMKDYEGLKGWESKQRLVRDLRALAMEEDVCIFTALQANKQGREALKESEGVISDENLADSYGSMRPLDALWSINQNQIEKELGIGRMFVVKHRDGKSRYVFYFKQDQNTLDTVEISQEIYASTRSTYAKKSADDVDKIVKPWKPNG